MHGSVSECEVQQWHNRSKWESEVQPVHSVVEWHNVVLVGGETHVPAPEVIQWHNVVLGEHGTTPDQIGVSVPKYVTERSEMEGSRALASVNKRERSERESSVRAERAPYLLRFSQYD